MNTPKTSSTNNAPIQSAASKRGHSAARSATIGLVAALVVGAAAAGATYWYYQADAFVGTVNGHKISRSEFDRGMAARKRQLSTHGIDLNSEQGRQMLAGFQGSVVDSLVDRQILLDAAASRGISVGPPEVETRLKEIKAGFGQDEQAFNRALVENGYTLSSLRSSIADGLAVQRLRADLTKGATVSAQEVKDYFDKNPQHFEVPEEVQASHILVGTQKEAADIESKLEAGQDFAALAKQYSKDPGSKNRGGDLGFFSRGRMVPEFEKAAFALSKGKISDPIKTQFGYHIIKAGERHPARKRPFAEVSQEISGQLLRQKQETAFSAWQAKEKSGAKVVIRPQFQVSMPAQGPHGRLPMGHP